jgi:hypothetical protein
VILLSQLAVTLKAGSKVKTPWSLVIAPTSRQSGPIVPERTGRLERVPVAGLIRS